MPASDLATDHQRQAIARHLIARLRELQAPPIEPAGGKPRERFMLFAPPLVRAILDGRKTATRRPVSPQPVSVDPKMRSPMGVAGDRLWVREKWGYRDQFYDRNAGNAGSYVYAADGPPAGAKYLPWKPSLHMPRAAGRVLLLITETRIERVTRISEADARDEGCPPERLDDPVTWFRETWDHYYAAGGLGWNADPFVWVIAFKVVPGLKA